MLRSLVGSEMCIRDRGLAVHREDVDLADAARPWARRPQAGREDAVPLAPCLLYTSDAADDLPCVDLGGRRIIKTKMSPKRRYPTPTSIYSTHAYPTPLHTL